MTPPRITPLERWIARKTGFNGHRGFTPETLARYQLDKLNETIAYAGRKSPFYRHLFAGNPPKPLSCLGALSRLPLTSAQDIRRDPYGFLCVSQSRVARVVTLRTSGTTRHPKRVFFTGSDLESTVDFFHHGMSTLVGPGQRVLILMPGELTGSVGDLLVKALSRMDVQGIVHGPVRDTGAAARDIRHKGIDCLVGIPAQVLCLARSTQGVAIGPGRIKSVLLSADYVPRAVVSTIERVWHCKVFQHYGMTESGLGGGVECEASNGYHLREADIYYEVVDPAHGRPVSVGDVGEVVFTTLTRQAMPLIRYRTGDLGAWIPAPCPCGTILRRMGPVLGRINGAVRLGDDGELSMPDLDEVVLAVPGIQNYQAEICKMTDQDHLKIRILVDTENPAAISREVYEAVTALPKIRNAIDRRKLRVDKIESGPMDGIITGTAKRRIIDRREETAPW